MLDWMFDRVPGAAARVDGLGFRVATATLAERYQWFSRERLAYLEHHPDTWKVLARMLPPRLLSALGGDKGA
jgi:hypothetical protein